MSSREEKIQALMLNEIAEKSLAACIIFSSFATLVFFYHFGVVHYKAHIQTACVVIICANVLRFIVSRSSRIDPFWFWFRVRVAVWMNAAGWSTVFSLTSLELDGLGIHYVIAMTILASFVTGSIVTLSPDKWSFFPFHGLMLLPLLAIAAIKARQDPTFYIFAGVVLFTFVYHLALYAEYRRMLRRRLSVQLDLEDSLLTLKDQTAQLVQTSKLAALGEMAGGMAHEINNPLAIIALNVKKLQKLSKKTEISELAEPVATIDSTVTRISRIIQGMRNVSRNSENGPNKPVLIKDILDDVLSICTERFHSAGVSLSVVDEQNLMETAVPCQRVQVSQVLINLLSNAFDVMSAVEDKWVKICLSSDGKFLSLKVVDGGPPIPPEIRAKIFQPFFTTKEVGKGTGLGLSISKTIVESHGGKLFLDPAAKQTTFVISLPLTQVA